MKKYASLQALRVLDPLPVRDESRPVDHERLYNHVCLVGSDPEDTRIGFNLFLRHPTRPDHRAGRVEAQNIFGSGPDPSASLVLEGRKREQ